MKLKNAIKKIVGLGTGIILVGSTVMGAGAYSLADYPSPFVTNGEYDFLPVYGDSSAGDDIAGAWDILGGLTSKTVRLVGTGKVDIIGGVAEKISLGSPVNTEITTLDDRDVDGLQDTEVWFSNDELDVHDEIQIGSGLILETSLTGDQDYLDDMALEIGRDDLRYVYFFDDAIDLSEVSVEKPVEITFLGESLRIINQQSSSALIVSKSSNYHMKVGNTITAGDLVDGKKVTLENVGQSSVEVKVDGVYGTVPLHQTRTINGVKITVNEMFYRTQIEASSADISAGDDSYLKIRHGDAYFGEDIDEPEFIWDLSGMEEDKPYIAITYDQVYNSYEDSVVMPGDCYNFPNDYFSVCLEEDELNYVNYEFTDDGDELIFKSSDSEGFKIGTENSDKLRFTEDLVEYKNDDGDWIGIEDENVFIENGDTSIELIFGDEEITIDDITLFGNWTLEVNGEPISTREEVVQTNYGVHINNPKENLEDHTFSIDVPDEQKFGIVSVSGKGTTQTGGVNFVTATPPPMVKASEVTNPEADNLLIIGGPVVNTMAERFLGSNWAFKPGEAIIELKENGEKVALLVMGTDAIDTRRAARVLRDYNLYPTKLVGKAVKVTGTSSSFADTTIETLNGIQNEGD